MQRYRVSCRDRDRQYLFLNLKQVCAAMKQKYKKTDIADLQEAVERYIEEGGVISYLPMQLTPSTHMVGSAHAIYEIVMQPPPAVEPNYWR